LVLVIILGGGPVAYLLARKMRGRKICLLGERRVGKTTLATFLSTGKTPSGRKYQQTIDDNVIKLWRIEFGKGKAQVKQIRDLSGSKDQKVAWKNAVADSDTIIYLFRADQLHSENLQKERVESDVKHIKGWLDDDGPQKQVCIVGTHCDLIEEYNSLGRDTRGDFVDKLFGLSPLKEMRRTLNCGTVIFGSLNTVRSTKRLASEMIKNLS
jgi:GTPase SAR1 family protein